MTSAVAASRRAANVDTGRRQLAIGGVALAASSLAGPLAGCAGTAAQPVTGPKPAASYPLGGQAKPMPAVATSSWLPTRVATADAYPVLYRRTLPPDTPLARYPGFAPGRTLLKKGTLRREGARPLASDIVFERDVALRMRDGITIYADVFRPAGDAPVPAIVAFSPYGKQVGGQHFDDTPGREAVLPLAWNSELQRFEGPDPAEYVARGYAVINPDPRGAYRSEGNISFWGRQTGEDGYDIVEWAARQPWCDGKIGMAGNSWLAVSQWHIAAQRPPHLAAIAPWEGLSDFLRETALRGGIESWAMDEVLLATFSGNGLVEDVPRMVQQTSRSSQMTPWWQDKAAALEAVDVPAYVVASYIHGAHSHGTFAGFRRIRSARKWLRIHNTREWHDFNNPAGVADLLKFFDHVLKGADNGWDRTPPVRVSVIDQGGIDTVARAERDWPLARQQATPLYLAADGALSRTPLAAAGSQRYAAGGGSARFVLRMTQDTEITGYIKARLWVQADGSDDMDLHVSVAKLGSDGQPMRVDPRTIGTREPLAASGILRVSRRALDAARSTPSEPYLSFGEPQPLRDGDVVAIEVGLWPIGMLVRAGQSLLLTVRPYSRPSGPPPWKFGTAKIPIPRDVVTFLPGSKPALVELGAPADTLPAFVREQQLPLPPLRNHGTHIVHFGGAYDSHLLLPVIPTERT